MGTSPLKDAFAHHVWATTRLIDVCMSLEPEQRQTAAPGTYGPILETMQHLVGADSWYLFDITGDPLLQIDTEPMDLGGLRAAIQADGEGWSALLSTDPDPDLVVTDVDDEGLGRGAAMGIRLAQALNHGTDHRSQICTALTSLGVEPPSIDVWDFGYDTGRATERARSGTAPS